MVGQAPSTLPGEPRCSRCMRARCMHVQARSAELAALRGGGGQQGALRGRAPQRPGPAKPSVAVKEEEEGGHLSHSAWLALLRADA